MSEFESPERSTGNVTVDDVQELIGASTPHFAMHIRGRLKRLIAGLPDGDPARRVAEAEISRLAQIAIGGETRGTKVQGESRLGPDQPVAQHAAGAPVGSGD